MWLGFPLGLFVIGLPFAFSYLVGASSLAVFGIAWIGGAIILVQVIYTWSVLADPMRGVDRGRVEKIESESTKDSL